MYMQRIANESGLVGYFADTEYNRMQGGQIKTILGKSMKIHNDQLRHYIA